MGTLVTRMLAAFQRSDFVHPLGRVLTVDASLSGPVVLDCPDIVCDVTVVWDVGEYVNVAIFKTSRASWCSTRREEQSLQLVLAGELVRLLVSEKPVHLMFAVLTKTKFPVLTTHEVPDNAATRERAHRIVKQVWRSMSVSLPYPVPSVLSCPTCAYSNPCQAWPG